MLSLKVKVLIKTSNVAFRRLLTSKAECASIQFPLGGNNPGVTQWCSAVELFLKHLPAKSRARMAATGEKRLLNPVGCIDLVAAYRVDGAWMHFCLALHYHHICCEQTFIEIWKVQFWGFGGWLCGWKCILCVFATLVLIEGGTVILHVNLVLNHRSAPDIPVSSLGWLVCRTFAFFCLHDWIIFLSNSYVVKQWTIRM